MLKQVQHDGEGMVPFIRLSATFIKQRSIMMKNLPSLCAGSGALALLLSIQSAHAQQAVPPADDVEPEIVITAPKLAGSVDVDIPADVVLDEAAIQSYGASSVTDLLSALSAQTRSGRGRSDGPPVVLVNGKRVSGFREIRDLPSEAIQRVEVLPEDVALRYGFTAEQRVVNFILKDNFAAITGEGDIGAPTAGGRTSYEAEAGLVRIGKKGRLNIDAEYTRAGKILERERGIIPDGPDETAYRSLSPSNEAFKINSVLNRTIATDVSATLSLQHDRADTESFFGISPASVGAVDPLVRNARTRAWSAGLTLDGRLDRFNWTATANGERTTTRTLTDQNVAQPSGRDLARSQVSVGNASWSITGPLLELPAGPVTTNVRTGFEARAIDSFSDRAGVSRSASISRDEANVRGNIDIPLASRRRAVADALGDLSINLNGGYRKLSDFGAITAYGYGLNWSPVQGVTLLASVSVDEAAPSSSQLGDPALVTPNALVFDYVRGETALVALTSGGNPFLRAEERRDVKLGLTYLPKWLDGLTLTANYFRNRSTDPLASFPALTAAVQAAYPNRFTRDAGGRLIAVDQRSINFLAARSEQLRWGVSFQKSFGQTGGGPGGARAGMGGPPPGAAGAGPRPGGGGGRGFGPFGGNGGRWSLSAYHTIKFVDEVDIAPGIPTLDLLGGDATGQSGGTPRHAFELEGGWFYRGIGLRVNGAHQTATQVNAGGSPLRFSDLTTLNLRLFVNFDQRKALVEKMPILKGTRIALRVDNLFDDIQDVRDATGLAPLRYQPGYLDPVGRTFEISLRKIF